MLPHPTYYIDRLRQSEHREEKIAIANFLAEKLLPPAQTVFVSGGTTAAFAAIEILAKKKASMQIVTHSVPIAWHAMELSYRKLIENARVELVGGILDVHTGVINHGRGQFGTSTFVFAPRSIGKIGLGANNDRDSIQAAWQANKEIILLATYDRLLDKGGRKIRTVGKLSEMGDKLNKTYSLIIPAILPDGLSESDRTEIEEVITTFEGSGVKIHRAPPCTESVLHAYFK